MSRPAQVTLAIRIMWTILAAAAVMVVGPIAQMLIASPNLSVIELVPILGLVLSFGLLALLIRAVSAGRNWARVVYTVCAIVAAVKTSIALGLDPVFDVGHELAQSLTIAADVLTIYLLFHPAANSWFRTAHAAAP